MKSCSITFKIKDFFPKIDTIPFDEYACLFMSGDYNEKIPLIEKDYNACKHQIYNVNSDLKYKIHLVNINDFSLIGICEIVIPYAIISQIDVPGTFIKEQQLKLFTDLKTKRKLFGTIVSSGDIYLYISAEVFVNNQNNYEKKKKNLIKDKNGFKKDFKNFLGYNNNSNITKKNYRIIKTDKDSLRNECKTYTCLKNYNHSTTNNTISNDFYYAPLSQERKDKQIIKHQSNPLGTSLKNTLTIDSNKNDRNPNQKIKKVHTQRKKLTILDLMEQKCKNKKHLNISNKNININIHNNAFSKNNSPKELKYLNLEENKENLRLNNKNYYFFSDKAKNHNFNYGNILKNVFSPINRDNKLIINDKTNYIYKKKSAQKIRTKISENNIFNYNSKSPYSISNFNLQEEEKKNYGIKKIKSSSTKKIQTENKNPNIYQINQINTNINVNNITDNNFIISNEEKQKLINLDKTILEKGVLIRNDFQSQLYYSNSQNKNIFDKTYDEIYNNSYNNISDFNINNLNNNNNYIRYNRSQKDFYKMNKKNKPNSPHIRIELDSSKNKTNNITPSSSNQNIIFTQEDLKNNIINLLDFYSLLKKKINMVKDNIIKSKQKLIIKKEKFNHQLKKNNRLTQKIISVESKIILHASINCELNEQIILPLMKIKKIESNINQNIFGFHFYEYDIMKFKEKEKNRLFEEQNIMHLLLIIIKNMIEHYGNISHVYHDDINRKKILQLLLLKYEIIEKKEDNINLNIHIDRDINNLNKNKFNNSSNNNRYINFNKSQYTPGQIIDDEFLNKFKIIREVEEDKEYDDSEEEEKIKNEIKEESELEKLDIENNEDHYISDISNEKEIENGATKNENEKSNKKNNNQYIDNNSHNLNNNKNDLINKILFEDFPKKFPNSNKFIPKNNQNEYFFGKNIVNIDMKNNNLEFIINNEKYNFEEFLKFFVNNNKFIDINENNKEEQINGIDSTTIGTEKSENLIKEKNEFEKNNKSFSIKNDYEDNNENYNSIRKEKRMKRKISIDEKNGGESNSELKNN